MESSLTDLVSCHRNFLVEHLEPDFGLVDKLYTNEILSGKDKATINAESTFYDRNNELLQRIQATRKYEAFIAALKISNQTHVVNYLERNGIYDFNDDWPLLDRERSILRNNHDTLVDLLDAQDLLTLLYSGDVINRRQMDFISKKQTFYDKNGALLDILSRRSIRNFKKTIRCLHESKQSHIAQLLDEGGVMVKVHAVLPDDRTEDEIICQFVDVLNNRTREESHRILEGTLNVIAMKKGESIVVYVYCKTFDELLILQELMTSGKLVTVLQKLFIDIFLLSKCAEVIVENPKDAVQLASTEIQRRNQIEKLTFTVNDEEYQKCKKYFLDVRYFTLEIIDIISRKCFLHSRFEESEMKHLTDKEVIIRLASVQFNWFQRIIKRRKKKKVPTATLR